MIYIVDDDEAVRDSLRMLLESHRYEVRAFASGAQFLATWEPESFGCVVLDLNMPGIDGFAVLDIIAERAAAWPVIVVTGRGNPSARERAFRAGATTFLEKPLDDGALLGAIGSAIERR